MYLWALRTTSFAEALWGRVARFRKIKVRFSSPVMLGDTISIRAWEDGPGRVIFDAMVNDKQVVSNAYFEYV